MIIFTLLVILILSRSDVLNVKFIIYAFSIITALFVIVFLLKKRSNNNKSISEETTIIHKPKKILGKLVFPNNDEFILKDYEKKLGREDFQGHDDRDNLLYIGKEHFKLIRLDDGFYIEDLNTKNGTKINDEDIRGLGKIKLRHGDEIKVAKIKIYYKEA
jgi:hypothetical protein